MRKLFKKLAERFRKIFLKEAAQDQGEMSVQEKIENLQAQIISISQVVQEQSGILVTLAKSQSEICNSISSLESASNDENCFLIKIPLSTDETVN